MNDKELDALAEGKFVLDCPRISLKPSIKESERRVYEGPGSIIQAEDGGFSFKIYCTGTKIS